MKTIHIKKIILLLIVIFSQHTIISAQGIYQLRGATSNGGPDDKGTIFTTKFDGTGHTIKKTFTDINPGKAQAGNNFTAYNNKLYTILETGGLNDDGIIACYDPAANVYSKLADLNSIGANHAGGKLTLFNGKLYGLSGSGGLTKEGTLFEFDPVAQTLTKKHDFINATGHFPKGNLTLYNNKLYGASSGGGANGEGVIFEFDPASNQYSLKANFTPSNPGSSGNSQLVAINNKLWGVTVASGGPNGGGYIYSFDPATNIISGKIELGSIGGGDNRYNLTVLNNKLYGMCNSGGAIDKGIIFQYDPITNVLSKEKDMTMNTSNYSVSMIAYNGLLYGAGSSGGTNDFGVLFSYDPVSNIYTSLSVFSETTGPGADCMAEFNNKMYFWTLNGAGYNSGALFEYTPATNQLFRKINLGSNDLSTPAGNTIYYNNNIYGIAYEGGSDGKGGIYMIDPVTNDYTLKLSGTDLTFKDNYLTLYNNKFYGCAYSASDKGNIFAYAPATNTIQKVYEFNAPTGNFPQGKLLVYNNKLLGTTAGDGLNDYGTLFEFDPSNNTLFTKVVFDGTRGREPRSGLDTYQGRIFGTARRGGTFNQGTLFEYLPLANGLTKLVDFSSTINMFNPESGVVGFNNKLYGVTPAGVNDFDGALYEYNLVTNTINIKVQFAPNKGRNAVGNLTLLNNKLYGMTDMGEDLNKGGALFEYDPTINLYTKKLDFTPLTGQRPRHNELNVIPAITAPGVADNCNTSNGVNINAANANEWIPFTDAEGRAVAEINANGNILGNTIVGFYINGGPVRQQNGFYYLDRSISFRSTNQPVTPVSIRLYIRKTEFDNLKTALGGNLALTDLGVFKNDDGCIDNLIAPATLLVSTPGSWATEYVFSANTTDMQTFYFAKANSVLPIKILSFTGEKQTTYNKLQWKASCTSGADFTLERSSDGQNFIGIKTIAATTLDCNFPFTYNDDNISGGKSYYRLKIVENSSAAQYSNVVVIDRDGAIQTTINVMPNPVTDGILKMQIQTRKSGNAEITINDMTGKKVLIKNFKTVTGMQLFQSDISNLAKGIYYLSYINGSEKIVTRFLKN